MLRLVVIMFIGYLEQLLFQGKFNNALKCINAALQLKQEENKNKHPPFYEPEVFLLLIYKIQSFRLSRRIEEGIDLVIQIDDQLTHSYDISLLIAYLIEKAHIISKIMLHDSQKHILGILNQCEIILKGFRYEFSPERWERLDTLLRFVWAFFYGQTVNLELFYKQLHENLPIMSERKYNNGIIRTHMDLGFHHLEEGAYKTAIKHFQAPFNEIPNLEQSKPFQICYIFWGLGIVYALLGEYDLSETMFLKMLDIVSQSDEPYAIARAYQSLGQTYQSRGLVPEAIKAFIKGFKLMEQIHYHANSMEFLFDLLKSSLNQGSIHQAKEFLAQIHDMKEKMDSRLKMLHQKLYKDVPFSQHQILYKMWNFYVAFGQAFILKAEDRLACKIEARTLFQQISQGKIFQEMTYFDDKILTMLNIVELDLYELRLTGNEQILDDIKPMLTEITTLAEKHHLYPMLVESLILQSRMAVLELKTRRAENLLTRAAKIAKENNMSTYADIVTNEQYKLFTQLQRWEEYIEQNLSLSERIELEQLETLVVGLVRQRAPAIPPGKISELAQKQLFQEYLLEAKNMREEHARTT